VQHGYRGLASDARRTIASGLATHAPRGTAPADRIACPDQAEDAVRAERVAGFTAWLGQVL
jgi:hypothetical protein